MRLVRIIRIAPGVLAAAGVISCATPAAPPEVAWTNEATGNAGFEQDRDGCHQSAADTESNSGRFDSVARGAVFMRCMTDRGWRQVPAGS